MAGMVFCGSPSSELQVWRLYSETRRGTSCAAAGALRSRRPTARRRIGRKPMARIALAGLKEPLCHDRRLLLRRKEAGPKENDSRKFPKAHSSGAVARSNKGNAARKGPGLSGKGLLALFGVVFRHERYLALVWRILSLEHLQADEQVPRRVRPPGTAGERSPEIRLTRQRLREENAFDACADTCDPEQVIQLVRGLAAHLLRQLGIEEDQGEMESVRLSGGDLQPARDLGGLDVLQKLEVGRLA